MAASGAPAREQMLMTTDGTPLFVRDWPLAADTATAGAVLLMHGLGEHCGRYAHVARFFTERGYLVRSYDHRGHGRSGGARGDVPDHEAILRDAQLVLDDFMRAGGGSAAGGHLPLLFGHSMGGLFAARFATARLAPLSGLILSSPALALPLSGGQKILLKMLGAIAPGLAVPNGLQTRYLSHDPAVEAAYKTDPLVHGKISARLLRSMLEAIEFAQAQAATLAIPTLLLVAGDDRLVDANGSRAFFPRLAPEVGTLHVYPDWYHEIFNERGAEHVFADLEAWLTAHALLAQAAPAGRAATPAATAIST